MAACESTEPVRPNDQSFHRDIDPTIIRLNLQELVPKADVQTAIKSWLDGINSSWKLEGDNVARKSVIQWNGNVGVAAARCGKAFTALRREDKTWRRIMVGVHELYTAPDKNAFQSELEIQVKKLRKAFCEESGMFKERVYANKNEGFFSIDFVPIAKVLVAQHTDTILYLNKSVAEAHDVDRETVQANFSAPS